MVLIKLNGKMFINENLIDNIIEIPIDEPIKAEGKALHEIAYIQLEGIFDIKEQKVTTEKKLYRFGDRIYSEENITESIGVKEIGKGIIIINYVDLRYREINKSSLEIATKEYIAQHFSPLGQEKITTELIIKKSKIRRMTSKMREMFIMSEEKPKNCKELGIIYAKHIQKEKIIIETVKKATINKNLNIKTINIDNPTAFLI